LAICSRCGPDNSPRPPYPLQKYKKCFFGITSRGPNLKLKSGKGGKSGAILMPADDRKTS